MPLLTTQSAKGYGFGSLVAAAAAEAYESIQTVSVGGGGTTYVDFTSIPQTYKHLQIRYIARRTTAQTFNSFNYAQFNGDTGNNYLPYHRLNARGDNLVYSNSGTTTNFSVIGFNTGGSARANAFAPGVTDIFDYSSTSKTKITRNLSGNAGQGTITDNDAALISSMWNSTAAITSIRLYIASADFAAYSHFALYGIKG
jgi:hypothetical protein